MVSGLPSDTGIGMNVEDDVLEDAVPENVQLHKPESGSVDSSLTPAPVPCPDPETTLTSDSDMPTIPATTSTNIVTDRRSRAGWLLRPVTRLLEMMHQKPVSVL